MEEVGAGQVKWNSEEFVPDLKRSGSRLVMGGAYVVQAGQWQFWVHLGLFQVEGSVFLKILLRLALEKESANVGLTLLVPPPTSFVALGKSSPNLISSSVKWELHLPLRIV